MPLIFVDVEGDFNSPCPNIEIGMTEFGAVDYRTRQTFYGTSEEITIQGDYYKTSHIWNMKVDDLEALMLEAERGGYDIKIQKWFKTMQAFETWVKKFTDGNPIFVSDNPAYDWQWINYYFHHTLHRNPFGFSARRIGDFYAGLTGNFRNSNKWKKLRRTVHDHNPVNDAMGNCEAFERMLAGERV